ncbi:MAG TPA: hypothetical protein VK469_22660 [Candidatus Kapabacteria bacterium]|nr:hypothetical protein [Candidatus Kapabacteria bacterium]
MNTKIPCLAPGSVKLDFFQIKIEAVRPVRRDVGNVTWNKKQFRTIPPFADPAKPGEPAVGVYG